MCSTLNCLSQEGGRAAGLIKALSCGVLLQAGFSSERDDHRKAECMKSGGSAYGSACAADPRSTSFEMDTAAD